MLKSRISTGNFYAFPVGGAYASFIDEHAQHIINTYMGNYGNVMPCTREFNTIISFRSQFAMKKR